MNLNVGTICLTVAGLISLVGCGPGGSVVEGSANLSDGSPAPRGVVTLSGDLGMYRGSIEAGKFKVESVPSGSYKVAVTGVTATAASYGGPTESGDVDTSDAAAYEAAQEASAGDDYMGGGAEEPKSLIHIKYSNPSASGLSLTVPSDSYELQLDAPEE